MFSATVILNEETFFALLSNDNYLYTPSPEIKKKKTLNKKTSFRVRIPSNVYPYLVPFSPHHYTIYMGYDVGRKYIHTTVVNTYENQRKAHFSVKRTRFLNVDIIFTNRLEF